MLPEARGDPAPFTYDISPEESPSTAVVAAVAAVLGYRPIVSGRNGDAADPVLDPLYSAVDPDALDAMFGDGAGSSLLSGSVRFRYHDCEVTVLGDADRGPATDAVVRVVPPESLAE